MKTCPVRAQSRVGGRNVLLLVLLLVWASTVRAAAPGGGVAGIHVLMLHSYNRNMLSQELVATGFEEAMAKGTSGYEIEHEYLDISPVHYPGQRRDLRRMLEAKYRGKQVDLVVAVYDAALDFLLEEGKELWPRARGLAVYSSKAREGAWHAGQPVVQVPLATDYRNMAKTMLGLFPGTRNVVCVAGSAPSARAHERALHREFSAAAPQVRYEATCDLKTGEILSKAAHLPANSVVLFTTFSADGAGVRTTSNEMMRKLVQASNAPVFCVFSSSLGQGALGGNVVDLHRLGIVLGEIAVEMGKGSLAPSFDPARYQRPIFAWEQVQRWRIPLPRFPEGTEFLKRPPTLWGQFREEAVLALLVMALLMAGVLGLVFQNRKRQEAERAAKEREKWIRVLIEEAPDAIVVYDTDAKVFIDANSAAEALFGCSREELLEGGPERFYSVPQPDGMEVDESIVEYNRRAMEGDRLHIQRVICSRDGRTIPCEVYLAKLPSRSRNLLRASYVDMSELRQAETDVESYRANLHAMIENTADMIWSVDMDFRFLTFNQSLVNHVWTSYGKVVQIGMSPFDVLPEERAAAWIPLFRRVLEKGAYLEEYSLEDGRCLELSFSPILQEGKVTGISVFGKDITQKRSIEEELRGNYASMKEMAERLDFSQKKYRYIVESAPVGIFQLDFQGDFSFVNPSLARQFGCGTTEEFMERYARDKEIWCDPGAFGEFHRHVMVQQEALDAELKIRLDGGQLRSLLFSAYLDEDTMLVNGFSLDVTGMRRAERSLAAVVDSTKDIICSVEPRELRLTMFNQAALETFRTRYGVELHLGMTPHEYHPAKVADRWVEMYGEALRHGSYREESYSPNGDTYYEVVIHAIKEGDGVVGLSAFGRNITDRKRAEAELVRMHESLEVKVEERTRELAVARDQAEAANRAKSLFLASMSHELRTPLNAVLGFTQLMANDPVVSSQQRQRLEIVLNAGEHLLSIINDILDLAKIESGKMEMVWQDFDLEALTNDLLTMLRVRAESKGLELSLDRSSSFPRLVRSDPGKLRQVLINLIGNAIKFTQEGRIRVKLSVQGLAQESGQGMLDCEISDTGPGIDERDLKRIFDPFVQLQQREGTGLGLTLTRQFVELLGGSLEVSSRVGQGTVFRFGIRYERAQDESFVAIGEKAGRIVQLHGAQGVKVLVVEDHPDNRRLVREILVPHGFEVKEAVDGREGVEMAREWEPQIILMDRRMPGMDGIEATREIRAFAGKDPVILALTAHAYREEREEMLEAGCDGFLAKPFSETDLLSLLATRLELAVERESSLPEDPPSAFLSTEPGLLELDPAFLLELKDALVRSDMQEIDALVQSLEPGAVRERISFFTGRFQYAGLLRLMEPVDPGTGAQMEPAAP